MKRIALFFFIFLMALTAFGPCKSVFAGEAEDAAKAETAVKNFEDRLEGLSKELASIRLELEGLTKEMLEGETGVAQIFLKAKAGDLTDKSVSLSIDDKLLFSRPLTPAELNVLGSELPLELGKMRLGAGDHKVLLQVLGSPPDEPSKMPVTRGKQNTWIVTVEDGKAGWNAE
ncbi:hypothetical protein EPN96_02170 [bacterium]|nr:MAG: hypothetical protein EPN96_02170 [bacterium]